MQVQHPLLPPPDTPPPVKRRHKLETSAGRGLLPADRPAGHRLVESHLLPLVPDVARTAWQRSGVRNAPAPGNGRQPSSAKSDLAAPLSLHGQATSTGSARFI